MTPDVAQQAAMMYLVSKENMEGDSPTVEDSVIVGLWEYATKLLSELEQAKLTIANYYRTLDQHQARGLRILQAGSTAVTTAELMHHVMEYDKANEHH